MAEVTESKGVLLMTWGKPQYGLMAHNLVLSIKKHSPSLSVYLIADEISVSKNPTLDVFDQVEVLKETPRDPGFFKMQVYNRLPFDHTLFLDVDGLALSSLERLLDRLIAEGRPYRCVVHDWYDKNSPDAMPLMVWAYRDTIWSHYGFTDDDRLPATQSSLQYIHKCDFTHELFDRLQKNYFNPIPLEKLRNRWGGGQPDELYLNVTLTQLKYDPTLNNAVWFCDDISKMHKDVQPVYPLLSMFGTSSNAKKHWVIVYDNLVTSLSSDAYYKSRLWKHLSAAKHANQRTLPNMRRGRGSAFDRRFFKVEPFVKKEVPGTVQLLTSYFISDSPARQKELDECMRRNCENKDIHRVINISSTPYEHEKVVNVQVGDRPTYQQFIDTANEYQADFTIIANTDIYFDDTLNWIHQVDLSNTLIALSRYDVMPDGRLRLFAYEWSQDTWIFKGRIKATGCDYRMGYPGCDNKFAYDCHKAGYRLLNPAKDIKTYHLHLSNVRTYVGDRDRLPPPYKEVRISSIKGATSQKLLIKQPGKVGDILRCLPIAKHYADQGYIVSWLCPDEYHSLFNYVYYVRPVSRKTETFHKEIDLSFGINQGTPIHKWWLRNQRNFPTFVHAKYHLAGVDVSQSTNLVFEPNIQREETLFAELGLTEDSEYVLFHGASTYGTPVEIQSEKQIVEFKPYKDYTIFDWRKVILKASEIHCIDSSLLNFVEILKPDCPKTYYRVPERTTETFMDFNAWQVVNYTKQMAYATV